MLARCHSLHLVPKGYYITFPVLPFTLSKPLCPHIFCGLLAPPTRHVYESMRLLPQIVYTYISLSFAVGIENYPRSSEQ